MASDIIILDTETTGVNRRDDQVIDLVLQAGLGADAIQARWRFKPSIPIPAAATAVHGITDADVADCKPFREYSATIRDTLERAAAIAGFNVGFDLDMIQAEYARLGLPPLKLDMPIIDAYRLWQQCEPRKLSDGVLRFLGREMTDAHDAAADVAATGEVLCAMLGEFNLPVEDWAAVAIVCEPKRAAWVGPSHHFQRDEKGLIVCSFGKNQGRSLVDLAQRDPGFLRWICDKDFPAHVRELAGAALRMGPLELHGWIARRFPAPAPREEQAHV